MVSNITSMQMILSYILPTVKHHERDSANEKLNMEKFIKLFKNCLLENNMTPNSITVNRDIN